MSNIILKGKEKCYIVVPEKEGDMIVYTDLEEAEKIAEILTKEDGIKYNVYVAGLNPKIA